MTDLAAEGPNAAQITYWNATAGPIWVAMSDALDSEIRPLGLAAMTALAPQVGERVIDIGCGCGDTTLELARRVGAGGSVLGADISAPMLDVARRRAGEAGLAQASFVQADAQAHAFAGDADAVFSRFGVMFFADPAAAFANIRRGLKPGGRLAFVCWRPLPENPWMTVPFAAAAPLLPAAPPPPDPLAPGPFAFADPVRVRGILVEAGFADIAIDPHDEKVGWGDLEQSAQVSLRVGPLGAVVRDNPQLAGPIEAAVREGLRPYLTETGVLLDSATWIVTARNG
jgi:SAM-dependent methyltransferase